MFIAKKSKNTMRKTYSVPVTNLSTPKPVVAKKEEKPKAAPKKKAEKPVEEPKVENNEVKNEE